MEKPSLYPNTHKTAWIVKTVEGKETVYTREKYARTAYRDELKKFNSSN